MTQVKSVAVILSGGSGSRFGGSLPKQFTKLAGKAIIEYTIDVFEKSPSIDEILVVSQTHHIQRTWDLIKGNKWSKVTKVVTGGQERFDSTYSALTAMQDYAEDTKVIFHDAVRPLIDQDIIQKCLAALDDYQAVDVVIPSADTLVEVDGQGTIMSIPDRSMMRRGQTPQGFRLSTLMSAYDKAIAEKRYTFTCDCGVLHQMLPDIAITTVLGADSNLKITNPIDLFIAEKFIQTGSVRAPIASSNLSSLKDKNLIVFGGSSGIGLEIKNMALAQGANVLIASRSHNEIDVTDYDKVVDFLKEAERKLGRIDYIVNTTGVLLKKPIDALSLAEINLLIDVNYKGAINVAIASKACLSKSKGALLNFTSSSYTRGRSLYALYSSSNAAIVNLTQALSEEWVDEGIRVNCINPERTATPMRTANFGIEPEELLLSATEVAKISLKALIANITGVIVDVRKDGR